MNKRSLGADALLLITAAIWGFGFVAQKSGMDYIGPFAFNGIRFLLGSLSLLPFLFVKKIKSSKKNSPGKNTLKPILLAGCCLFIAVSLQQIGIMFTGAGNAGFITGLYVVLVPVLGIFWGRKTLLWTWIGMAFTISGLFLIAGIGAINPGDWLIAAGAIFWAFHVLIIDRYAEETGSVVLSSGQFAVCGILSLAAAFIAEPLMAEQIGSTIIASSSQNWLSLPDLLNAIINSTLPEGLLKGALVPVLYGGFASVGIAYTLQVTAQKNSPPAHAVIILSLEGFFAALGGILILGESFDSRTIIGFVLMLAGMLISQLGIRFSKIPVS